MSDKKRPYQELLDYISGPLADLTLPEPLNLDVRHTPNSNPDAWKEFPEARTLSDCPSWGQITARIETGELSREEIARALEYAMLIAIHRAKGAVELQIDRGAISEAFERRYLPEFLENTSFTTINGVPREQLEALIQERERLTEDPAKEAIMARFQESLVVGKVVETAPPREKRPTEDLLEAIEKAVRAKYGSELEDLVERKHNKLVEIGQVAERSDARVQRQSGLGLKRFSPRRLFKNSFERRGELKDYTKLGQELAGIERETQKFTQKVTSEDSIKELLNSLSAEVRQSIERTYGKRPEAAVLERVKESILKIEASKKQSLRQSSGFRL